MDKALFANFINHDLPDLIRNGAVSDQQVSVAVGIVGLLHDAFAPNQPIAREIDDAANILLQKILGAYELDPSSTPKGRVNAAVMEFIAASFADNPALRLLKHKLVKETAKANRTEEHYTRKLTRFLGVEPVQREVSAGKAEGDATSQLSVWEFRLKRSSDPD